MDWKMLYRVKVIMAGVCNIGFSLHILNIKRTYREITYGLNSGKVIYA